MINPRAELIQGEGFGIHPGKDWGNYTDTLSKGYLKDKPNEVYVAAGIRSAQLIIRNIGTASALNSPGHVRVFAELFAAECQPPAEGKKLQAFAQGTEMAIAMCDAELQIPSNSPAES